MGRSNVASGNAATLDTLINNSTIEEYIAGENIEVGDRVSEEKQNGIETQLFYSTNEKFIDLIKLTEKVSLLLTYYDQNGFFYYFLTEEDDGSITISSSKLLNSFSSRYTNMRFKIVLIDDNKFCLAYQHISYCYARICEIDLENRIISIGTETTIATVSSNSSVTPFSAIKNDINEIVFITRYDSSGSTHTFTLCSIINTTITTQIIEQQVMLGDDIIKYDNYFICTYKRLQSNNRNSFIRCFKINSEKTSLQYYTPVVFYYHTSNDNANSSIPVVLDKSKVFLLNSGIDLSNGYIVSIEGILFDFNEGDFTLLKRTTLLKDTPQYINKSIQVIDNINNIIKYSLVMSHAYANKNTSINGISAFQDIISIGITNRISLIDRDEDFGKIYDSNEGTQWRDCSFKKKDKNKYFCIYINTTDYYYKLFIRNENNVIKNDFNTLGVALDSANAGETIRVVVPQTESNGGGV